MGHLFYVLKIEKIQANKDDAIGRNKIAWSERQETQFRDILAADSLKRHPWNKKFLLPPESICTFFRNSAKLFSFHVCTQWLRDFF